MSTTLPRDRGRVARWQRWSLVAGLCALVLCLLGALFSPAQFFRAWLAAYVFYLGIALGSMPVLMIYHLTGGAWGLLVRRILEAALRTLPLLAVLFVPIALGLRYLYPWANPELVAQDELLAHQQFYFNPVYFWIRAAIYFLLWIGMAFFFDRWSQQEDRTGNLRAEWKAIQLSGFGAVIYGLTIHFASIDWVLSLQSEFPSTIFGPLFASGQILSGMAFAAIVLAWLVNRPPLAEVASAKALNDVGSLLFSFLVIWAYMAWFQFMLVWIANLPQDVIWYLPRAAGGWQALVWVLFVLHFAVPFFLLLVRSVKRNPVALGGVAGLILLAHLAYNYWQVLPPFPADRIARHWMDFLTPIAIGGLWAPYFVWQLGRRPLLAAHDYNRAQALELRRSDQEEAEQEEALVHG